MKFVPISNDSRVVHSPRATAAAASHKLVEIKYIQMEKLNMNI